MTEPDAGRGDQVGDELPLDLQPAEVRGRYSVPDNSRRRRPALVLAVAAALCLAGWMSRGNGGVLVNEGFLWAAAAFAVLAAYFALSARPVRVWESGAISVAERTAGFPAVHARAQLAWRGLFGRPIWRVLVYERAEGPGRRAVVVVDAGDGSVVEHLTEQAPGDASEEPTPS